jgi:hypothetical protein
MDWATFRVDFLTNSSGRPEDEETFSEVSLSKKHVCNALHCIAFQKLSSTASHIF